MLSENDYEISELQSRIEKFSNQDYSGYNIEQLKKLLDPICIGYVTSTKNFHPGAVLFRGVKWDEKPQKISALSYPPQNKAKINRASREGVQMFYCSNALNVPCFELNLVKGDRYIVSKWVTRKKCCYKMLESSWK